jgi:hypothetical protein
VGKADRQTDPLKQADRQILWDKQTERKTDPVGKQTDGSCGTRRQTDRSDHVGQADKQTDSVGQADRQRDHERL